MLTQKRLENLRPRSKTFRIADTRGLCVEVRSQTGLRCWRFRYRFAGRAKMLGLGTWPAVSLAEARKRCADARELLARGIDPSRDRKEARQAQDLTLEAVAREWLDHRQVAPATLEKDRWLLEDLALPALGRRPVGAITPAEILDLLRGLEQAGKLETAQRLRATLSRVFRYAVSTQHAPGDPTSALRGALRSPRAKHHAAITDPRQLGDLLRALHGYTGTPVVVAALQLSPLLFVRPGELRQAEWAEIDFDQALWRIPAARMKMRRDHLVPLSRQALGILRGLAPLTGRGKYVFPGARSLMRPMSENTVNVALRSLGYSKEQMTAHGFRTTASTFLHEQGFRTDVIERQLAHQERNAVKDAYNRAEYLEDRQRMMQAWADYRDSIRAGG